MQLVQCMDRACAPYHLALAQLGRCTHIKAYNVHKVQQDNRAALHNAEAQAEADLQKDRLHVFFVQVGGGCRMCMQSSTCV